MKSVASGIVYRNPRPYLKSIHAWHPSIVRLPTGELVSTFDLAEAGESLDYHTCIARSTDHGQTWSAPQPLLANPSATEGTPADSGTRRSTHTVRIAAMSDGALIGMGGRFYRDDPTEGLVNRANLGYVPMDLFLIRSSDGGRSWTDQVTIQPPLVGPAFEMCHRVVELADGRWLFPTSTWRGWHGAAPQGMQAIALVSSDRGQTWPAYLPVIDQSEQKVISWEQGLTQLPDGRLLAVVWSFDEKTGGSLPNRFTISQDGQSFGPHRENGLQGETAKLLTLADGRILCVYRRRDRAGLWANLVQIKGDEWINLEETPLWQGLASGMSGARSSGDELGALKFGYPSMVQQPDGKVLIVFWCVEDCLHIIRWVLLEV